MKVVFLDFDGVLNTTTTTPAYALEAGLVALLNVIVKLTGAKVVVSSAWRAIEGLPYCVAHLERSGFQGEVIGATPERNKVSDPRGLEIQAWLDEHPEVEAFVILDDEADMEHLLPKLVQTSFEHGLTEADVEKAARLLGVRDLRCHANAPRP